MDFLKGLSKGGKNFPDRFDLRFSKTDPKSRANARHWLDNRTYPISNPAYHPFS